MTGTKIQLEYIKDEGARNSTLRKRKRGLIKKTHKLTTLCGVQSCVIIYGPNKAEPAMWPNSRPKIEQVIQRYKEMTDFQKNKSVAEQDSAFSQQELAEAREQLDKIQKENKLKELRIMVNLTMSNDGSWMQNLDDDYLTIMKNDVLEPQLEQMESRINALLNLEPYIALPQRMMRRKRDKSLRNNYFI